MNRVTACKLKKKILLPITGDAILIVLSQSINAEAKNTFTKMSKIVLLKLVYKQVTKVQKPYKYIYTEK